MLFKASGPVSTSGYIILILLTLLGGMYFYQHYRVKAAEHTVSETKAIAQTERALNRAREAEKHLEAAEDVNENLVEVLATRVKLDEVARETVQLQKIEVKKLVTRVEGIKQSLPPSSSKLTSSTDTDKSSFKRISAIWDAYCYPSPPNANCTE